MIYYTKLAQHDSNTPNFHFHSNFQKPNIFDQLVFSTVEKRFLLWLNCSRFCLHKVQEAQILIGYQKLLYFSVDEIDTSITFVNLSKTVADNVAFFSLCFCCQILAKCNVFCQKNKNFNTICERLNIVKWKIYWSWIASKIFTFPHNEDLRVFTVKHMADVEIWKRFAN